MYGSPAMSKDLNLPFPASPFKQGKDDADLRHQQQQQQMSSPGLLRYRSAPNNVIGDVCDEAAAESMFARFIAPDLRDHSGAGGGGGSGEKQPSSVPASTGGYPSSDPPHMFFHSPLQAQQQIPNMTSAATVNVESNGGGGGGGGSGNLVRHSSSPAGLFSHLNVDNGFGGMRNIGGFRSPGGGSGNAEAGTTSTRLKGQISFSSRQGSSGLMSLSEMSNEGLGGGSSSPDDGGGGGVSARCYIPGYPVASWEDSVLLSDTFSGAKRVRDPTEAQNGDMRNHGPTLTHHFSLPKTPTEMAAMERFLQFQDAVPCKIRAKRGCATHPRSIAERVRRTRISERMRKLQELVPNMDKQTNTADMLDLAVDYIKDLQRQAKRAEQTALVQANNLINKQETKLGNFSNPERLEEQDLHMSI